VKGEGGRTTGTLDPGFGEDFSADQSGAELFGAERDGGQPWRRGPVTLSGVFVAANSSGVVIRRATITGDCSDTKWDGMGPV
jgi:hypothetical protein